MEKRTKLWRKKQGFRVFKARIICHAASYNTYAEGIHCVALHWFELAKEHGEQVYRTTSTPCSCWMCRGYEYNRLKYKRETLRIIRESLE